MKALLENSPYKSPQSPSPEIEAILIEGCRIAVGGKPVSSRVSNDLDFESLLELSDTQRVTPYVFEYLDLCDAFSIVDNEVKEQWQKACDLYASRYYWRKAQWADVRALFAGIGRDFIPMKGAAFGFRIYPKPFRDMSDFDVLIRESELLAVHACLGKSGVSPVISPSRFAWHDDLYLRHLERGGVLNSLMGKRNYGGHDLPIDLHWRLFYPVEGMHVELNLDMLWKEAKPKGDGEWSPGPSHEFLLALVHAASTSSWKPKLSHWVDVMLLERGLKKDFDTREFLFATPALTAGVPARALLWQRFETMRELFFSKARPALPEWMRRIPDESFRELGFQEHWEKYRAPLLFLNTRERWLYFAGFCFPNFGYYKGLSLVRACLSFYRSLILSTVRMVRKAVMR